MDDRTKNLVLTIVGASLILVTIFCLPALVYLEVAKKGSVSTQLAALIAIPLGAGAAMIKSSFSRSAQSDAEGSKEE